MPTYKHIVKFGAILAVGCIAIMHGAHGGFGVDVAYAAPSDVFNASTQATIAKYVSQAVQYLNVGTWTAFVLMIQLLDPAVMFDINAGGGSALLTTLNNIWQLSRDLMNVIFALLLIIAAIYTIITANKEFISSNLKNFVIAVVLVNFSWFFPRILLDVANVTTSAVYGIPSLIQTNCTTIKAGTVSRPNVGPPSFGAPKQGIECEEVVPGQDATATSPIRAPLYRCACEVVSAAQFFVGDTEQNALKNAPNSYNCDLAPVVCYKLVKLDTATQSSITTTLNGLVINHGKLQSLAALPAPIGRGNVGELISYVAREIVILVIAVALFFPVLALAVAFLIRIPILWITIAFFPFYFIKFLPFANKLPGDFNPEELIMKNFISAAFLPAITAVPLTVGYIMLNAAATIPPGSPVKFPLLSDIQDLYQIVWLCMALGVMWIGVFGALKSNKFVAGATEAIRGFGKSTGSLAAAIPLSAPIPTAGGVSPLQLLNRINPRNLNANIRREGLAGFLKGIKGETALSGNEKIIADEIKKKGKKDDVKKKIDDATTSTAKVDLLITEIKKEYKGNVNEDNLVDVLKRIQDSKQIDFGLDAAKEAKLREKAAELKKSRTPPAPTPTTTPVPTPKTS